MSTKYKHLITPHCCSDVELHKTVFLQYSSLENAGQNIPDWTYDDEADKVVGKGYVGIKPEWGIKGVHKEYNCEEWVSVKFCPHCGKLVPEIEENPLADTAKLANNDDEYCNTCGERNMCCQCLPPWFAWRPVGVEIILPEVPKDEDDE